jgi:hypothetical protein
MPSAVQNLKSSRIRPSLLHSVTNLCSLRDAWRVSQENTSGSQRTTYMIQQMPWLWQVKDEPIKYTVIHTGIRIPYLHVEVI